MFFKLILCISEISIGAIKILMLSITLEYFVVIENPFKCIKMLFDLLIK